MRTNARGHAKTVFFITDQFSDPGAAIGRVCVCVFPCVQTTTFEINDSDNDIWHARSTSKVTGYLFKVLNMGPLFSHGWPS